MGNFTVTISPTAVNSLNAKWCIVGVTDWLDSAENTTSAAAGQVISFRYVEGYLSPDNITITASMIVALGTTATYTATQWLASWGAPISGCLFRGQVLTGGRVYSTEQAFPSESRIVRWSEIGSFRFLDATANAKKNEAGFMFFTGMSDETVMRVLPLEHVVVVYSTCGVILLSPVSQPAPTFSVKDLSDGIGILNPLAVGGSSTKHVYIDREGNLHKISMGRYNEGYVNTNVGYSHIFKSMQEGFNMTTGVGIISVVYNADEDEFYISDGIRSFLFNDSGLTEIGQAITSYINLNSSIISNELFPEDCIGKCLGCVTQLESNEYIYLESDINDFSLSSIKTIQQVEVAASFGLAQQVYVMVKWRNNRSEAFRETRWVRCSPNGVATPIVSGVDFKLCIRISPVEDVIISGITVEWKITDKTSLRGNYANNTTT